MTIRNLLIAYNGLDASQAALRSAKMMQKKYDAHLTGIVAHGGFQLAQKALPWMPEDVRTIVQKTERAQAEDIRTRFFRDCEDVPQDKLHWIDCAEMPDKGIAAHARLFDMTILGLGENAEDRQNLEFHPDRVALISGRPILAIPASYHSETIGHYAMIGWDGGRASARALFEAMNILETKSLVEIVMIDPERTKIGNSDKLLVDALERHSIKVKLTCLNSEGQSVPDVLMRHAIEQDTSILVLGAYEHSKFRENLVGGTTTKIVQNARVPVLVAY